jgi:hypothetical protein
MKHNLSDDRLFAYVDNELDAGARAEFEAAIAADPSLAKRVEDECALRALLGATYDPVLSEALPKRLLSAAQAPAGKAKVLDLAAARESRRQRETPSSWTWQHWGGMAACLVIGIFAGRSAWLAGAEDIAARDGHLVARGPLAQALSTQLASAQASDAPVKIGLSYLSRGDEYCRSFSVSRDATGGLACRRGGDWELRVVTQDVARPGDGGSLRMAASPVPAAVLRTIDEQISGSPLDAEAERAVMQQGWRK